MKNILNRTRLAVVVTALGMVGFIPTRMEAEPSSDLMNSILRSREQAAKVSEYVHTCIKCGDDSAFCCTTQPGAGPTKGMKK